MCSEAINKCMIWKVTEEQKGNLHAGRKCLGSSPQHWIPLLLVVLQLEQMQRDKQSELVQEVDGSPIPCQEQQLPGDASKGLEHLQEAA